MRAGQLRHYITIQERVNQQDPVTGANVEKYRTKYAQVPSAFVFLSGREFLAADQIRSEVKARVTVRSGLDLDSTDRILHLGKAYNIEAILPDPTFKRHDTLMVSEGVRNDGDEIED